MHDAARHSALEICGCQPGPVPEGPPRLHLTRKGGFHLHRQTMCLDDFIKKHDMASATIMVLLCWDVELGPGDDYKDHVVGCHCPTHCLLTQVLGAGMRLGSRKPENQKKTRKPEA